MTLSKRYSDVYHMIIYDSYITMVIYLHACMIRCITDLITYYMVMYVFPGQLSGALSSDLILMQSTTGHPIKKAKSQLNELFQKYGVTDAKYSSDDVIDGNVHNFRATLTYTVNGRKYRYESHGVFGRKQDAQEDAAQQALCDIEQQQQRQQQRISSQAIITNHC